MWLAGEPGDVHTKFWWGNPRERNNFEDLGIDGSLILKWVFKIRMGNGLDWSDSG
jgi:hypothetical protein